MAKNIAGYLLIVFGLVTLWASTSRTAMQYISDHRDVDKWWGSYQCKNGDLVSLCYLDFVKVFNPPPESVIIKRPKYNGLKNTELYLNGDSFTWHLNDTDFAGLSGFHYSERIHGGQYHLDSTRRNVLVIEISERYLRGYFGTQQIINDYADSSATRKSISGLYLQPERKIRQASFLGDLFPGMFFNKFINQNLQCNLFNYQFIMPMFESKAALNYYLFNRASGDVVISDDRKFLFLRETVSRDDNSSSYSPVSGEELSGIVNNLNVIYAHYRANGFSEVYLAMIPNSASIMQPRDYNNLIPLIQNDPRLMMKTIDIYSVFKESGEVLYRPGDTHWNNAGRQLWLDLVNQKLMN